MSKLASIIDSVEKYTHLYVGAGAVALSAVDTSLFPPKFAAGVVIASQALKVVYDIFAKAPTGEQVEAVVDGVITVPPKA